MKFVCEVNGNVCLFNQEDIIDPKAAAQKAFGKYLETMGFDKPYEVAVYFGNTKRSYYFQRAMHTYECIFDDYGYESVSVEAENYLEAGVKGLLNLVQDYEFEDNPTSITVERDDGSCIKFTFKIDVESSEQEDEVSTKDSSN